MLTDQTFLRNISTCFMFRAVFRKPYGFRERNTRTVTPCVHFLNYLSLTAQSLPFPSIFTWSENPGRNIPLIVCSVKLSL
jgi:hypothetical protein